MKLPRLKSIFSDNGQHSHWALMNIETGEKLWSEDPEECKAMGFPVSSPTQKGSMDEFSKGYACAVAALIKMYGNSREAEEVYGCNFLSVKQLRKIGADEGDIETLIPLIKEIERKKIASK